MANKIKYIHNLQGEDSLQWGPKYPLAVNGINVDLFNEFNLEEELKIGGGNHQVNIFDNTNNTNVPSSYILDLSDLENIPVFSDNKKITSVGQRVSSTKIIEEYSYNNNNNQSNFTIETYIEEFPVEVEKEETVIEEEEYNLTFIQTILNYTYNVNIGELFNNKIVVANDTNNLIEGTQIKQEDAVYEKNKKKAIFILENSSTTEIQEVIVP